MSHRRFVALGDSTTEGLMDLYPDGSGYRGWADRLAEHIDAADPGLLYANLGIRGRKVDQIRADVRCSNAVPGKSQGRIHIAPNAYHQGKRLPVLATMRHDDVFDQARGGARCGKLKV